MAEEALSASALPNPSPRRRSWCTAAIFTSPPTRPSRIRKEKIVDGINERWGKPGEVEISKERLKHQEKETWGDIIKGRSWDRGASYLLRFSART